MLAIETVMRRGERPIEAGPAPELLRLRSVVRGSTGGLQSSARCSSSRVTGGGGTELSPAAGRSCRANLTWLAFPLAFLEGTNTDLPFAVLARSTGLAFPLAFLVEPNTEPSFAVLSSGTVGAMTPAGSAVLARSTGLAIPFAPLEVR